MSANSEWAAGLVSLPSYVMDGSQAPFRPSVFLCVDVASGYVLAADVLDPQHGLDAVRERYAALVRAARDRQPRSLRVATSELADALRGGGIRVILGATPEIDEVFQAFLEHASRNDGGPDSYLGPGVDAATVAKMFAAAARLYVARPWAYTPPDGALAVDCPALSISNGLLVVVGQMGQNFGFAIFPDRQAFDALQQLGKTGTGTPPAQIMFRYDTREELSRALVDEVRAHRWKLAGPAAYPNAVWIDGKEGARPLDARELAGITAVANALAALVEQTPNLLGTWRDLPPMTRVEPGVSLTAPAPLPDPAVHPPREPALSDLMRRPLVRDRVLDPTACETYVTLIEAAFLRSPEAREVAPEWVRVFLEHATQALGLTIAQLIPFEVRDLVYDALPRSLIAQPEDARSIISTIQAVLDFAARELGTYAARWSATSALDADAVETLAAELAEPANFGPAKTFFMQGVAAGYDMTTQAGIEAWTRAHDRASRVKAPAKRASAGKRVKAKSPRTKK